MAKEFNICFMFPIWLKTFRKFILFDIATPEHRNLFCFVLFLLIFLVSARVLVSCCLCFAVCFCLFLFIQFFLSKSTKSSRAYPVTNNACHFGFQQVVFSRVLRDSMTRYVGRSVGHRLLFLYLTSNSVT